MKNQIYTKKTLQKLFSIILLLIVLSGGSFFGAAQNSLQELSDTEKTEIFEEVWTTIGKKYYDANFNSIDWKQIREKYRPLILQTDNRNQFYELLDRMAGELRDSHTRVFPPDKRQAAKNNQATSAGLLISEIEGVFAVSSVAENGSAERAGIKNGMRILAVGGVPIAESFAEARKKVGASSSERAARLRGFSLLLASEEGSELELTLARNNNDKNGFTVRLKREKISVAPDVKMQILSSGIAYLKFNSFDETTSAQIENKLKKLKSVSALILDLRNNSGGDGEEGLRVAGFFLNRQIPVARLITRDGKPPLPEIPMKLTAGKKGGQIYKKNIVILVSERTASTAELITAALQENKRARVFGTQTCGCVLGFINYNQLKDGGAFTFSEFGFVTPKGRRLEGAGVMPDQSVKSTLSDLQNKRDAVLERAENYLKSIIDKN